MTRPPHRAELIDFDPMEDAFASRPNPAPIAVDDEVTLPRKTDFPDSDEAKAQMDQARKDGETRQRLADAADEGVDITGRAGRALADDYDGMNAYDDRVYAKYYYNGDPGLDVKTARDNNRGRGTDDGGLGTYPGGQSSGGNSEFVFERPLAVQGMGQPGYAPIVTAEMKKEVWASVSGPCKGAPSRKEVEGCVEGDLKLNPESRTGKQAIALAARAWHALRRPATEGVDTASQEPSMEDVIAFNGGDEDVPEKARKTMDTLQKALDQVVNTRNLDLDDLTAESHRRWNRKTRNMCCEDMFDVVCKQPCLV
jgi:hypothetical protein